MRSRSQEILRQAGLDFRGEQDMTLLRTVFKAGERLVDDAGRIVQLADDGQATGLDAGEIEESSMSRCMRWAARLMRSRAE